MVMNFYRAYDDDGNEYMIVAHQGSINTTNLDSTRAQSMSNLPDLTTNDGRDVSYVSKGVYDVIGLSGTVRVRCDEPNAP